MKAATKLATLPFGELDRLVKAIGECKSKAEEDRIIAAEVDVLKQRLSDPRLDKSRGREYMVRVMYCEMLGHDVSFAYIPVLQMASDPNLHNKKAAYLCLTQLLDHTHELVLLLVNTLLSDLKSDNFVVTATGLVVTSRLIGPDLINAVLPNVVERLSHPREAVRKKAIMALLHFHAMDPTHSGPLAGVDLERHFRTGLCDKEPSVMGATLNALAALAAERPAPLRPLIPSLTSILKQVVEHKLPKAYDYHRFPAPFIQIKLLKLLRLLAAGDKAASDNVTAVVATTLRRAAAGGNHTIGHAIVYEAVRTITAMYPNPALLASAAEAVAVLIKSSAHNLKYCGLTALADITRVSPKYAQEHQMAVIDCLEDPDDTLKLKTLELLVTMTKANNVQVVVERLMAFLRASSDGGDEVLRRHIAGQVVDLAERYAPDTTWFVAVMAEVFEVGGDVLQPQLAHNLCRLIAEQDEELHTTAVQMFLRVLDEGTAGSKAAAAAAAAAAGGSRASGGGRGGSSGGGRVLPDILLCTICWVLGEYGSLGAQLAPPHRVTVGQIMDKLCAAVASSQASPTVRAYLLTALTKLAARQLLQQQQAGTNLLGSSGAASPAAAAAAGGPAGVWRPEAAEQLHKAEGSRHAELQQRAHEAAALLGLPPLQLSAVLPFDGSCEELEASEVEAARGLTFLEGYVNNALAAGAQPYNPPPELLAAAGGAGFGGAGFDDEDLEALALGLPGGAGAGGQQQHPHKLRFDAYETAKAPAPGATTGASAPGGAFGGGSGGGPQQQAQQTQQQTQGVGGGATAAAGGQPSLALKGAGRGRWGPAEFAGGGSAGSSSSRTTPAAAAAAAPTASAAAAPAAGAARQQQQQQHQKQQQQQRVMSERDRQLAASLFGGGGGDAAGGIRGRQAAAAAASGASQPAAAAPVVVADLLGGDMDEQPAAAAAPPAPAGLDMLMDLDGGDQHHQPPAAPAAAAAAAAAGGPGDLLAGLAAGPAPAAPAAAPAADPLSALLGSPVGVAPAPTAGPAPGAAGALGGLDLLGLQGSPAASAPAAITTQQQQQQQQQPAAAAATGAGAAGGIKGIGGVAMRGGRPAKGAGSLVNDPFKDLLG